MTRTIPIGSRGQYEVAVDEADYAFLTQWKWTFKRSSWKWGAKIYARRCVRIAGVKVTVYMHTLLLAERMGLRQPSDGHEGDHVDTNSLNNTRGNLRWATKSEQNANQAPRITIAQKITHEVAAASCEVPF